MENVGNELRLIGYRGATSGIS
ncbi:hypothetical protein A2U01_0078733, partial [Trifolium medium]|nr:hypothetical protein [Trifolium medium]